MTDTLTLRKYEKSDASVILGWIKDEVTFRRWSADKYDKYPAVANDMNRLYDESYPDKSRFYPITAVDGEKIVGHMLILAEDVENDVYHFGFIIIDDSLRGKGYGRRMLNSAIDYTFNTLSAKKITLGVFENNAPAHHLYRSIGFHDEECGEPVIRDLMGEKWRLCRMVAERKDYE